MLLLSGMFCGDNHCFDYSPTSISDINSLRVQSGIYDEVFVTKNAKVDYNESSKQWDYDTVLYAKFKDNLIGGNVDFTANTVSSVRIKRRRVNEYHWITLFEIPIKSNKDFNFERLDKMARANTEYEYSFVPVINGAEGNPSTNTIESDFDGYFLVEKDTVYRALLNTSISIDRNHNGTTISTVGRKYPFYIQNGLSNYVSGTFNATFIPQKDNCEFDVENGWQLRDEVDKFLTNGKPKILKNDEGRMWMIAVVDNIPHTEQGHYQNIVQSINWIEVGDAENPLDLYDNNFIDYDSRIIR